MKKLPAYLSQVTLQASTENLYWNARLIGALADSQYPSCVQLVTRYRNAVAVKGRQIVREYDAKIAACGDAEALGAEANEALCRMAKEQTADALTKILNEVSTHMKNGYNLADN